MTQTTPDEPTCTLAWNPGSGGLLAVIDPAWVPGVPAPRDPTAVPIAPEHLHVTLLRRASMLPLVDVLGAEWSSLAPTLPRPPRPTFRPLLHRATRPPHPTKDPPDETRPRTTWFVVVEDQQAWQRALAAIAGRLAAEAQRRGELTFAHPEPQRLFHLSLYNDRGGDPARSIGDIGPADCPRIRALR